MTARRIIATARLLESDKAGERQAAAEALVRLTRGGPTIAQLLERALAAEARAAELPEWQARARRVLDFAASLTNKELRFARTLSFARFEPSPKQGQWLADIAERLGLVA